MTFLAILLILLVLTGYGLFEYYKIKLGAPTSTPPAVRDEIFEFLEEVGPTGRLLDLGSGWGGFVLNLAKRLPRWQIDGVEAAPTPWFISNCRSIGSSNSNYRFFIGNMDKQTLRNYDIVYINQPVKNMLPIMNRLVKALQNDCFIFTYPHPLPRIPDPDIILSKTNDRIYMYRGIYAVDFLNPPVPVPSSAFETPPEPEQEPTPVPADFSDPTPDNTFEQLPVDVVAPFDADAPPADLPPAGADFPEQGGVETLPEPMSSAEPDNAPEPQQPTPDAAPAETVPPAPIETTTAPRDDAPEQGQLPLQQTD